MCLWSLCIPCGFECMQCVNANHAIGEGSGMKAFLSHGVSVVLEQQ